MPTTRAFRKITQLAFSPVDILGLVTVRVVFGALMLWEAYRFYTKGWIHYYFIRPGFFFSYEGFEWIQPWAGNGIYWHFALLAITALLILLGLWYRFAILTFTLAFAHMFLIDKTHYLNHFYLAILVGGILFVCPANRAFALDAKLNPSIRSQTAPAWCLWLLSTQIAIVYIYGGFAKMNEDWFRGEPMRTWLAQQTDFPLIGQWFRDEWLVYLFSYGGLFFDLFIVPALLWKRTRWLAVGTAVAFHLFNARFFVIGMFPWFMIAALVLFIPSTIFRAMPKSPPHLSRINLGWKHYTTLTACSFYLLVQLLVPFRRFLYHGPVAWTGEGERFAWLMKLADIRSRVLFLARTPESTRYQPIDYQKVLTPKQRHEMHGHPDMIWQFSRYLLRRLRAEWGNEVELYVSVEASLNGREPQQRLNPRLNLAEIEHYPKSNWILPLKPMKPTQRLITSSGVRTSQ